MAITEKAVLRFIDGNILKGYLRDFSTTAEELCLQDANTEDVRTVSTGGLKAIFFVKSFEGNKEYYENKSYGARKAHGRRIFIKFTDGEDMVGFTDGDIPWKRGFFLSSHTVNNLKGFYLFPADEGANNIRIFVYAGAVRDVTVVP
jgi:hypothetical protein